MNAAQVFDDAIKRENSIDRHVVRREDIKPLGGNRISVAGKEQSLSDSAYETLRKWLRYPVRIESALSENLTSAIWQELYQAEINSPKPCVPKYLYLGCTSEHVAFFSNADRIRLSFSNIREALEESTVLPSLEQTDVHHCQSNDDSLNIRFTFKSKVVEPRVGDIVSGGIELSHDLNEGTFLRHYLHRLACENGMTSAVCRKRMRIDVRGNPERQFATQDAIDELRQRLSLSFETVSEKLAAVEDLARETIDLDEVINGFVHEHRLGVFCLSWTLSEIDELEYSSPPGDHDVQPQAVFPRAKGFDRSSPLA